MVTIQQVQETILSAPGVAVMDWYLSKDTAGNAKLSARVYFDEAVSYGWGDEIVNNDAPSLQSELMDLGFGGALYDEESITLENGGFVYINNLIFELEGSLEFNYIDGYEIWSKLLNMGFPAALSHSEFVSVFGYDPCDPTEKDGLKHEYEADEVEYTMQYYPATATITASVNIGNQLFGTFDANTGENM